MYLDINTLKMTSVKQLDSYSLKVLSRYVCYGNSYSYSYYVFIYIQFLLSVSNPDIVHTPVATCIIITANRYYN